MSVVNYFRVIISNCPPTVGGKHDKYSDLANFVVVKHDDGSYAEYLHLKKMVRWLHRG